MQVSLRILIVERDRNGHPVASASGAISTRPFEVVVGRRMGHLQDLCLALGIDPETLRQDDIALETRILADAEMMFPGGRPALNRRRLPAYAGETDLVMNLREGLKQARTPGATASLRIVDRGPDDDTFGDLLDDIVRNVHSLIADSARDGGPIEQRKTDHDRSHHPRVRDDTRPERSRHP